MVQYTTPHNTSTTPLIHVHTYTVYSYLTILVYKNYGIVKKKSNEKSKTDTFDESTQELKENNKQLDILGLLVLPLPSYQHFTVL